jgi:hypothetical protein
MSDEDDNDSCDDNDPEVASECSVTDPRDADQEEDAAEAPQTANATTDPNRYTIYVPVDQTVFSLGKGSSTWIKDDGITGKTKKHIHFEVKEEDKTIVVLGGPALDSGLCGWEGDSIAAQNKGYAMVTDGFAWHEAKEQHVILCSEGDVMVRTSGESKFAGVQSDSGKVLVFGGEAVTLGSPAGVTIGATPGVTPVDLKHEGGFLDQWTPNYGAKIGSFLATVGEVGTGIAALVGSLRKAERYGESGKPGFVETRAASAVKMVADMALTLSTMARAVIEFRGKEMAGSVGITGQNFVGITAGVGASMYGQVASAVVSAGQAELLGGVSALVKGLLWTEIAGGIGTALTALGNIEIAATKGEIEIAAKKEVKISAYEEHVLITAKGNAQLVSNTEHAMVWGKESAFLGAKGYAVEAKEDVLTLGKATAPENFKAPAIDNNCIIEMKDAAIMVKRGDSMLRLKTDGALLKGSKVNLHAESQNVQINGQKILLN